MSHVPEQAGPRFVDRVALVTGANRGIGLATARMLAAEGARVVAMVRDPARSQAAAALPDVTFAFGDVRRAGDCEEAVRIALDAHGRLDVLVNNAGVIYRNRTVEEHTEEEWDATFDTNVKGVFLMCRAVMASLRASRGVVVNVASYVGLVGFPGAVAYAASKGAVVNLTRTLALDHARDGVRVNCVCPGSVDTDMIHEAWRLAADGEAAARASAGKHPMARIASADEVANAVLFLASDDASFVTGVALPVDGGITAA